MKAYATQHSLRRSPPQRAQRTPLRHPKELLRLFVAGLMLIAALLMMPGAQAAPASAGGSGAGDQTVVQQLLEAMAKKDYQGFVRGGTPSFAQIGEAQFTEVANSIGPRLEQGYTVQYLGNLQQQGLDISVWKVSFTDQGDDLLATLNVQDGSVGGFFLR